MNYKRISELYALLDAESKKSPVNQKRIDEINHYLAKELGTTPPVKPTGSFWNKFFPLPENWKIFVTSAIGALVAINSQLHLVPQNVQDALLAVAISLGFWAVSGTQTLQFKNIKNQFAALAAKQK